MWNPHCVRFENEVLKSKALNKTPIYQNFIEKFYFSNIALISGLEVLVCLVIPEFSYGSCYSR